MVVRVKIEERAAEIVQLCNARGWQVIAGIESDEQENITDVDKLMGRTPAAPESATRNRPVSGNDYCPCGSGNKFRKCCGK